jgi:hypothetical protein
MKIIHIIVLAFKISTSPQFPAASAELSGTAPGEFTSFLGVFSSLLFGGSMPKSPLEYYLALYGTIQNQVSNQLNNAGTSALIKEVETLTNSLNDQMISYVAQVETFQNQSRDAGVVLQPGQSAVPPEFVDITMKGIDAIISSSLSWYNAPQFDPRKPTAFLLTDIKGLNPNLCLHTQDGNTKPGTNVVIGSSCDLNHYDDKLWGVAPSGQLILRTVVGNMCVAYKGNNGKNNKDHLAIYSIDSPACQTGIQIKFIEDESGLFGLYENNVMLCIKKAKWYQFLSRIPVIANPLHNKCENANFLQFQNRIPVNINAAGAGGATGNSLTPALTFDQIGVQLYFFPIIASVHLASLKELYQYGSLKETALSQFDAKVEQYMIWLASFVPMFDSYSTFVGIDATEQITTAMDFFQNLQNVTINLQN